MLLLSFLLSIHLLPSKIDLQVGEVSPEEIRAHKTVNYVDSVETERLRQEAAERVEKQYRVKPGAAAEAVDAVGNVFSVLHRARSNSGLKSDAAGLAFVRGYIGSDIVDGALLAFLNADRRTFTQAETYSKQLIGQIMSREIRDDESSDVINARAEFRRRIVNLLGSTRHAEAAVQIGSRHITANRIFDQELTDKAREKRRESVPSQRRPILTGETVIDRGERVTPEHIDRFTALGLRNPQIDYGAVVCILLLVTALVTFTAIYMARYHARIYDSPKLLLLLALIVVLSVLGLRLGGTVLQIKLSSLQFSYFAMIWIATAGMMIAMLLDPQLAVLVVAMLSTTTGLAMNHELRWALAALVSGLVAVYAVSDIRTRLDLMRAGLAVGAANLAMVWLIGRISGDSVNNLLTGSVWAVGGGVIAIMLFWLGTTALEKPFDITTHNRLVELSDTNNPMLKRLLMEAPGTFTHSISVGNIASMAADVIGADALLVRVASYYHDLGKIKRPHFFVENQYVENAHDRLNPTLSALVIRSHIKDGLELAREYRLPPLIRDIISQHHGTSLVRYFYSRAMGNTPGDSALEQQFRYEGVKPQSREAALLMLADAVEAASRSLAKPTPGQIEDMVDKIIAEKLTDGQLDESELTFKDISRIRGSFVRTLTSMMHARIEYPDFPGAEGRKAIGSGSSGKEPASGEGGPNAAEESHKEVATG